MLMAQYYWIPFWAWWHSIIGSFLTRTAFVGSNGCSSGRKVNSLYSFCESLQITSLHSFFPVVWASGVGSRRPMSVEVRWLGGHTRTRRAAWGISRLAYCLWGPYFLTCQSPTLENCFDLVHVSNLFFFGGGWQGRRTSHVPPSLPPPLIFKVKFTIFVTLPS